MPSKKTKNKSIFVSSTFRDMQSERDALRDFVLPRVNEFAAKYGPILVIKIGFDPRILKPKFYREELLFKLRMRVDAISHSSTCQK